MSASLLRSSTLSQSSSARSVSAGTSGALFCEHSSLRAVEAGGEHIHFGGLGARGLGLHMAYLGKRAVEPRHELLACTALQHLGEESAAGNKNSFGEIKRRLDQAHDAQMVGLLVTGRRRVHVRHYEVYLLAIQRPI